MAGTKEARRAPSDKYDERRNQLAESALKTLGELVPALVVLVRRGAPRLLGAGHRRSSSRRSQSGRASPYATGTHFRPAS